MFKIVLRDSNLYLKQLSLFCVLMLISACTDRIGHITNFCSMIELKGAARGGAEGAQAPPLAIRILMFIS